MANATRLLIKNGTLIDGSGRDPVPNRLLVVEGNRIALAGETDHLTRPSGRSMVPASDRAKGEIGMTDHRSADEGTQQHDDTTAEPMTSARSLSIMQAERAEWEALLARVEEARMTEPGIEGPWSVKDIVAHLTWYDHTLVEGAQTVMRGGCNCSRG